MVDHNDNDDTRDDTNDEQSDERPTEQGKPGDIKNGYRWDQASRSWVRHAGIDFSKDQSRLPHNFQHAGDGSPESPHRVQHSGTWA